MRVVIVKNEGGYGFADLPIEEMQAAGKVSPLISKLQSELSSLKDDVNALKALIMVGGNQPTIGQRVAAETARRHKMYPEEVDTMGLPKTNYGTTYDDRVHHTRKLQVMTPNDLTGGGKILYDDVCNGINTFNKLAEKYPEFQKHGSITSSLYLLYKYGFVTREKNEGSYVYSKGSDYRLDMAKPNVNMIKKNLGRYVHGRYNTSPLMLKRNSKLVYQKISEGLKDSKSLSIALGIPQNCISGTLNNLFKHGFVGRYKEPVSALYKYSIINVGQIKPQYKEKTERTRPKRTLVEERVLEAIKNGKRSVKEITEFVGQRSISNVQAYVSRLLKNKQIARKAMLTPEYRRYFTYMLPTEKTEEEYKSMEPKTNPYEASVRGLAKHLNIMVTENAIKELARNSDWETILKQAHNEKNHYMGLDAVKYFKSILHGGKEEKIEEVALKEPSFDCPHKLIDIVGEPASQKVIDFIRSCEEKKTITPQDFAKFLYGANEKEVIDLWNGWFSTNIFWLVKEAFGRNINAKLEKNPDDSSFVVKW